MPFNAGAVEGQLELDTKGFVDALNRARRSLDSISKSNKDAGSSFQTFSRILGTVRDAVIVLPALFNGLTAPIRGLFNQLREASGVAAEFEVTTRKLTTALALAGNAGAGIITERLKAFADELQNTTGISNTLTLGITQTLTVLGVQQDQLEDAATAVLNYAEATGRDATQAAIQFGRTLSGLTGELGEALPAVRELTAEELQAGKAFEIAGELFAGTAEQVAQTTVGLRRALASAFADFQRAIGDAINPVLDAITVGMKNAVESLTELVRNNEGSIRNAFADIARGILEAVKGVFDFALDIPAMVARARSFIFDVVASVKTGSADIEITALRIIQRVQEALAAMFASFEGLPIIGEDFKQASEDALVAANETAASVERSKAAMREQVADLVEGSNRQKEIAAKAQEAADAIRDGSDATSGMAVAFNRVNDALDTTIAELDSVNQKAKEVSINVSTAGSAARGTIRVWKSVNDAVADARSSTNSLSASTSSARANTAALASEAERAAAGFSAAAGAASALDSATATAGESRRAGARAGLNLDDPFAAAGAVANAEAAVRAAGFSRFSSVAMRSARVTADRIAAEAQASVDRAIADFTSSVLDELNRAGVYDSAERSRIVSERVKEAQRFGVLPASTVGQRAGGLS